jgi:phage terminase large subunit-like protein
MAKAVQKSECGRYWYDERAADAAAAFFPKYLRFTEGEWAGKPFVLEHWEEHDIIRPLFGWKREDGTRRYRRCDVWVPRKNGKTELAAGIAILMQLGDGEKGGQVFAIAKDQKQSSIVFNKAVIMVQWSEELAKYLTCFRKSIFCQELMARFEPLSGTPEGKHGLNMSGLVGDEIHEWPDARLYTFVHQSSASRRQPLEFLISTAGERKGYGWEVWQDDQKQLAGEMDDPERLVVVYAADPDDDWQDEATWRKANPNLGVSVKLEYLRAEAKKARELPRLENDFKRYHLNLWTEQAVRWLPMDTWDECGHALIAAANETADRRPVWQRNDRWRELPELARGMRGTAGLDLSSTTDLTALVWTFPPEEEGGRWIIVPRFFIPEARIMERARRDKVPYDQWVKMGAMTATPGNVVDYAYVKHQLYKDAEIFGCNAVAIDRWNATQIATEIRDQGLNAVLFGQGYASMSAPTKELERVVLDRRVDHGGHPVLRWCAGNVAIDTDPAGNIKPAKDKSTERIDGVVATIMGFGVSMAAEIEGPSVYETRGLLSV